MEVIEKIPVSNCCGASVYDPSGEEIEGRCNLCQEMCGIEYEEV